MLKALFALVAAALFAGAALSIGLADHPARLKLDTRPALDQWQKIAGVSTWLLAGLALLSLVLGAWAWWKTGDDGLLIGALLMGAVILVTLVVMTPINRRLVSDNPGTDRVALLRFWGRMHGLRTALGLGAVASYLVAFLWP